MEDLKDIIASLERQRAGIDRALSALVEIDGASQAPATKKARGPRKGGLTAAGRKRISDALKRRWAAKKAAQAGSAESTEVPVKRRRGRKRGARKKAAA